MTIRSNKLVAYVDTPYSYQIPATQGPTSWTTDGTPWHPKDLVYPTLELISGTPNASGEFTFPITVFNSEGNMTRPINSMSRKEQETMDLGTDHCRT